MVRASRLLRFSYGELIKLFCIDAGDSYSKAPPLMADVVGELSSETHQPSRRSWQFTVRGLFVLVSSAAIGLSLWKIEQDWLLGAWGTISLWVVLGLAAQAQDLWRISRESRAWMPEERWGLRFAIAWRLAIACLIVAYFLVRLLVMWQALRFDDGRDSVWIPWRGLYDSLLLSAMIVAIGSSPRLVQRVRPRWWSRIVGLLVGIASGILSVGILLDSLLICVLVHIATVGIELAQPLQLSLDALTTYDAARMTRFFLVTTAGLVSLMTSYGLLRLLSVQWRRAGRRRAVLGGFLALSLSTLALLVGWIALVEFPAVSPFLAANIRIPKPHQLVGGSVLTLLLVTTVARRWSVPPADSGVNPGSWRRDEGRYYHEYRVVAFLLAGVIVGNCVTHGFMRTYQGDSRFFWQLMAEYVFESPPGYLSLALILLAARRVVTGWRKRSDAAPTNAAPTDPPRLAPALFSVVASALLAIVVFGVPILATWGFSLWFILARRPEALW